MIHSGTNLADCVFSFPSSQPGVWISKEKLFQARDRLALFQRSRRYGILLISILNHVIKAPTQEGLLRPLEKCFALIRLTPSSCLMCVESIWSSLTSHLQSRWKTLRTASTFLHHPFIVGVITLLATDGSGHKGAGR